MRSIGAGIPFARLSDGAIYGLVTLVLLLAALSRGEHADTPPAPPPLSREEGRILPSPSPFGPQRVVKISGDLEGPRRGTAFSVDPSGLWLTARHVVEGCTKAAVAEGPGRAAEAQVLAFLDAPGGADVAVLRTLGGAPALPIAEDGGLRIGQRGFHPGFPGGRPGEATSRLLGRQFLETRARAPMGRRAPRRQSVLTWAEAGRTQGLHGGLAGLSGAPVLDARGRVVGLTLADAPRRGRLYTASAQDLRAALAAAGARVALGAAKSSPMTVADYGVRADSLRRDLSVAEVFCLDPS
jgi:S1-C subfamily serine protease